MDQADDRLAEIASKERRPRRLDEPEVLPLSLVGNWIAWSSDGLRIIAYAKTLIEVEKLAHAAGEPEPIFERHPGDVRFI